jgi:hypothetical protein
MAKAKNLNGLAGNLALSYLGTLGLTLLQENMI